MDLYTELLKATDNTSDITWEKYGIITKVNNNLCNVKEINTDLEHSNVPILNNIPLTIGDKVIIIFIENSIYNPIVIGTISRDGADFYTKTEIDSRFDNVYTKTEIDSKINDVENYI